MEREERLGEAAKSVAQHVQGICIDDDDNDAQLLHFHNFHNFSHFSPMTDSSRQSSEELWGEQAQAQ